MSEKIKVTLYRWAGKWGPFEVKISCGECTITKDILHDVFENELAGVPIELEVKDWLDVWWEPLFKGAYHAPIVVVGGKVISQGAALNRGVLVESLIKEVVKREDSIKGNVVYGKEGCPFCKKAKDLLDANNIEYEYKDVIKESSALYRMIPHVKRMIGEKTPVTVPQIWIDDLYVGGFDDLEKKLK